MKKILIFSLIVIIGLPSLFASTIIDVEEPFAPVSARVAAMGGAGLATASGIDAFFINPANLSDKGLVLNLPMVSATVYGPKSFIDSGILDGLANENFNMGSAVNSILTSLSPNLQKIVTTDVALSFNIGGFGLGLFTEQNIYSYNSGGEILADVSVALPVGLGVNIDLLSDILSLDVGVTVKPTFRAYTSGINIVKIGLGGEVSEDAIVQYIMGDVQLMSGIAFPIDVGLNINLPFGFRVSGALKNINGNFTMEEYKEAGAWINDKADLFGFDQFEYDSKDVTFTTREVEIPMTLDFGFGWVGSFGAIDKFVRPAVSIDFVDVLGYVEEAGDYEGAFFNHLKAGAEVRLLSTIDLRGGINRGAYSIGVGLDLFAIRIDASYYWQELGKRIGDRSVDAFTIRFNLGYDR